MNELVKDDKEEKLSKSDINKIMKDWLIKGREKS